MSSRFSRGVAAALVWVAWSLGPAPADAQAAEDARPSPALDAAQVVERWHSRLAGRHFTARVRLHMILAGLEERRDLTVFRDDASGQGERVVIRFERPADLRGVGVLYLENRGRPNDYFLYQPTTRRVRRLPPSIADDDVYGIDLEFLGFGVAQSEPTEVVSMRRVDHDGRDAYLVTERALEEHARFDSRRTWVDANTFVPLRTEQERQERTVLIAQTELVEDVSGVATPRRVRFSKPGEQREVLLEVESVDYASVLPEEVFSILSLTKRGGR